MELETKDPEIKPHPLCLENISKEFSVNDMKKKKKNRIKWKGIQFSVSYEIIDASDIEDIYKHLMKKHNIV